MAFVWLRQYVKLGPYIYHVNLPDQMTSLYSGCENLILMLMIPSKFKLWC